MTRFALCAMAVLGLTGRSRPLPGAQRGQRRSFEPGSFVLLVVGK